MKGSKSKKSVKKQAGKDPWGAEGRKRREAEMARARKVKTKAAPGAARNRGEARGRSRSPQPEAPRAAHAREARSQATNSHRKILIGLLVLMALAIVGYILSGPLLRNVEASAEIKAKQMEFEKEQAKAQDLRERKAQANDMSFLEEEARRIGYVLPGEIPVIVVEEVPSESTDANPAQNTEDSTSNPNP